MVGLFRPYPRRVHFIPGPSSTAHIELHAVAINVSQDKFGSKPFRRNIFRENESSHRGLGGSSPATLTTAALGMAKLKEPTSLGGRTSSANHLRPRASLSPGPFNLPRVTRPCRLASGGGSSVNNYSPNRGHGIWPARHDDIVVICVCSRPRVGCNGVTG